MNSRRAGPGGSVRRAAGADGDPYGARQRWFCGWCTGRTHPGGKAGNGAGWAATPAQFGLADCGSTVGRCAGQRLLHRPMEAQRLAEAIQQETHVGCGPGHSERRSLTAGGRGSRHS